MSIIKCSNCGKNISENNKFCPECGEKIEVKMALSNKEISMIVANNSAMTKNEILNYLNNVNILESRKYGMQQAIKSLEDLQYDLRCKKNDIYGMERMENGDFGILDIILCGWGHFFKWTLIGAVICAIPMSIIPTLEIIAYPIIFGMIFGKRYLDLQKNKELCKKDIEDAKRDNSEIEEKIKIAENKIKEIKTEMKATDDLLAKLYNMNIIHPKYYKNIVAVTSFYDYIDTGRCIEFGGPRGIYDTYETEVRLDTIIWQLDEIIEQLEQIKQNQFTLYQAITAGNSLAKEIFKTNERIQENTKILAENSEILTYIELFENIEN